MGSGRRVVNGPKKEVKAPENVLAAQIRQAFGQSIDEGAVRIIEVLSDELFEQ